MERDIPQQAVEAFRAALGADLVAVVLFGSRARGEASAESDWDLLVIARSLPAKPFTRHLFLKRLLPPSRRGAISVVAKTPEEFEARVPSLYLDIALDGQVVYDPHGYATNRLAALKRLIKQAGLYRKRTEAGEVWRCEREPIEPLTLSWEA